MGATEGEGRTDGEGFGTGFGARAGGGGGGGGGGGAGSGSGAGGSGGGGGGGGAGFGGGGGGGGGGFGFGGGVGVGSGTGPAKQLPSPLTATAVPPSSSPMDAYAQLSALAGVGAVSSQVSASAAASRQKSDPYTTGSMFRAARRHAGRRGDSPDGGDLGCGGFGEAMKRNGPVPGLCLREWPIVDPLCREWRPRRRHRIRGFHGGNGVGVRGDGLPEPRPPVPFPAHPPSGRQRPRLPRHMTPASVGAESGSAPK
ncbi:hypothetical protein SAMN05216483_0492 [Streptomyces sp. 2131.1]|nr:hypothetical protein SAMN05216483_0492 [Streptomyces sp. 2131.1]